MSVTLMQMCRNFQTKGRKCLRGPLCRSAHSRHELGQVFYIVTQTQKPTQAGVAVIAGECTSKTERMKATDKERENKRECVRETQTAAESTLCHGPCVSDLLPSKILAVQKLSKLEDSLELQLASFLALHTERERKRESERERTSRATLDRKSRHTHKGEEGGGRVQLFCHLGSSIG